MKILKNAYVLTLNPLDEFARYSLCIDEGKIVDIIKHGESNDEAVTRKHEKWNERSGNMAETFDCTDKMVMPGLVNSCLKSESSLIKYLLRKRQYEVTETDLCTDFIFNYIYQELPTDEIKKDLDVIYRYSFGKNLKYGVVALNEITPRKDTNHLDAVSKACSLTGQNVRLCFPMKQEIYEQGSCKYSYYLTDENQLTIYDLSTLSDLKSESIEHLFLEVATNKDVTDKFKQTYSKPVVVLLDEYGLIDSKTSLINPLYLTYDEMKILSDKEANIIVCPSDLIHFSNRYFPLDDFLNHNIKYSIGTGWLGEDLFHEIRIFRNKYKELNISNADFLRSITCVPSSLYFSDVNYQLDVGKSADLIFVDISDIRFQLLPESTELNHICDFLIDNLTSFAVSDVMIGGNFKVRNSQLEGIDEHETLVNALGTRDRLYRAGKYEEIKLRNEERKDVEQLDLRSRDEEEIKMFSDSEAASLKEDDTEVFRIKGKLNVFKHKTSKTQKNLFEEPEVNQLADTEEFQETPSLNLLHSELDESKHAEEEIIPSSAWRVEDARKRADQKKTAATPAVEENKKIELPSDVKLKFGDD